LVCDSCTGSSARIFSGKRAGAGAPESRKERLALENKKQSLESSFHMKNKAIRLFWLGAALAVAYGAFFLTASKALACTGSCD
jgi:hypothetical protein